MLEIAAVVLDDVIAVALLHDRDLLYDVLEVSVHRDLLDGQYLTTLLVQGFVDASVRAEER